MRGNKKRDTKPELAIRRALHALGLRYRVNAILGSSSGVRARPDVVFPRERIALFVDGCFWHGCPDHGTHPRANNEYWRTKLRRNQERDAQQTHTLRAEGWRVIRVWEHEDATLVARRTKRLLIARRRRSNVRRHS
jgi:DNA mismatch endonuclease, patch repair protein